MTVLILPTVVYAKINYYFFSKMVIFKVVLVLHSILAIEAFREAGFQKFIGVGDVSNIVANDPQQHGHGQMAEGKVVKENHNYGKFSLGGKVVNSKFGQMPSMTRGKFTGGGHIESRLVEPPSRPITSNDMQTANVKNYGKFLGNGDLTNPIFYRPSKPPKDLYYDY